MLREAAEHRAAGDEAFRKAQTHEIALLDFEKHLHRIAADLDARGAALVEEKAKAEELLKYARELKLKHEGLIDGSTRE